MASLLKFSPIPDDSVIKVSNVICSAHSRNKKIHSIDDTTVFTKNDNFITEFVAEVTRCIPGCEVNHLISNIPPLSVFHVCRHTKIEGSPHTVFVNNLATSLETLASRITQSNKTRSYKFVYDRVCVQDLVSDEFYELDYRSNSFKVSTESRMRWYPKQMQVSVSSKFFS